MSGPPPGKRNIVCSSPTGQGQLTKDMDWQSNLTPKIDYGDYNHADGGALKVINNDLWNELKK